MAVSGIDVIPMELWGQIISKLHHESGDHHLQSLSLVSKHFLSITNLLKQTLKVTTKNSNSLPILFQRFPNLKHFSLSKFSRLDDPSAVLLQIADSNFHLETLDLSNLDPLPLDALSQFPLSILSGVKSLSISSLPSPRDHDLEMWVLASKLKSLMRINTEWISNEALISISENCPDLEEIVLKYTSDDNQAGIGFALRTCKKLKSITIGERRDRYSSDELVMDELCEPLCCATSLSKIDLRKVAVSDAFLFALANACLPLKSFALSKCNYSWLSYDGVLSFLQTYHSLEYLALEGVGFLTDESMVNLASHLTEVRVLKLNRCGDLSDSTLFTLLKQCPLLHTIEMTSTSIGISIGDPEQGGSYDSVFRQITTLDLSSNESCKDTLLAKIASSCPNLEELKVRTCTGISRSGVGEILRKCRGLKSLNIDECSEVDNLDLDNNTSHKLECLGAVYSGLNDKALIDVSEKCPNLMSLNVMHCEAITSKGVVELVSKCTKLKEINLHRCRNVGSNVLSWMVFCSPNIRKIAPPTWVSRSDHNQYLLRSGIDVGMEWFDRFK